MRVRQSFLSKQEFRSGTGVSYRPVSLMEEVDS
jgi:hypothetical protein